MQQLLLRFAPQLCITALLAIGALCAALAIVNGRLADVRKDLQLEQALHETDSANFRATQALANSMWQAEVGRLQTSYTRLKDEADRQSDRMRADYAARVMRLPTFTAGTDQGAAGAAALPGTVGAAGIDGSGGDTVLLARSDALICATNTARLLAAADWAEAITLPSAPSLRAGGAGPLSLQGQSKSTLRAPR